jgi:tetratricopeptide (TPR) repeat protein
VVAFVGTGGRLRRNPQIYREGAAAIEDQEAHAAIYLAQADLLFHRGELDHSLEFSRKALLVLSEDRFRRERAVTLGQIADVLYARGELEEALRIRREEELPVYERLGDVRSLLVGQANLALTYLARDQEGDRERATTLLLAALQPAVSMGLPEVQQIVTILKSADLPLPPQIVENDESGPASRDAAAGSAQGAGSVGGDGPAGAALLNTS